MEKIIFPTPCKTPRPIRCCEETRRFAQESLDGKYGRETLDNKILGEVYDGDFLALDEVTRTRMIYLTIAEQAPLRHVDGELLVGAATLGTAISHRVPYSATADREPVWFSNSHLTAGFDRVLREGLDSYEARIRARRAAPCTDGEASFLDSLLVHIEAFHIWHKRYLTLLHEKADGADGNKKEYYETLIKNLERVPFETPRTFREGLQALWFTFAFLRLNGNWPGIGRIDLMLGDLFEADLASGVLQENEARELLAHFFIKGCEWVNLLFRGSGDGQHYQNIVLGGMDESGRDRTNLLTRYILETVEEFPIADFPIAVRYSKRSPDWLLPKMAQVIRHGSGVVAMYSEDVVIDSLTRYGYPLEDARRFANDGCWEVQIPGATRFAYYAKDVYRLYQDTALCMDGRELPDYPDFESFYHRFLISMYCEIDDYQKSCDAFISAPNTFAAPTPIALFEDGCIENARDYECGGPRYVVCSLHFGGFPDVANSMMAVKKLVFEEKKLTIPQLREILQNNWEGEEALRQYVRSSVVCYGNDSDEADKLLARMVHDYTAYMEKVKFRAGVHRTAGISTFGRQIDWKDQRYAHAHGFHKGDILAGNLSPTPSTDVKGATAIIRSCCKTDFRELSGGTVLDIRLDPSCVNGEEGLSAIEGLLRGFETLGGYFIQMDVVDSAVLREAQKHPEQYQSLAVRVSGWSARFVTLNDDWQRMIIERTEQKS